MQYVHAEPIEHVFDKINDYATMSEAYHERVAPEERLIQMGLVILINAGIFADKIMEWNKKDPLNKSWDNFQKHFIKAQTTYKKNRPTETSASLLGYSGIAISKSRPHHASKNRTMPY